MTELKQSSKPFWHNPKIGIVIVLIILIGFFYISNKIYTEKTNNEKPSQKDSIVVVDTEKKELKKIDECLDEMTKYIDMTADDILKIKGKPKETNTVGRNENGLIVEWKYNNCIFVMKRYEKDGITAYRVYLVK